MRWSCWAHFSRQSTAHSHFIQIWIQMYGQMVFGLSMLMWPLHLAGVVLTISTNSDTWDMNICNGTILPAARFYAHRIFIPVLYQFHSNAHRVVFCFVRLSLYLFSGYFHHLHPLCWLLMVTVPLIVVTRKPQAEYINRSIRYSRGLSVDKCGIFELLRIVGCVRSVVKSIERNGTVLFFSS